MSAKYLNQQFLEQITQNSFRSRNIAESILKGFHKSRISGTSLEFKEHREYTMGDEIKKIDWKLYGRTKKLYVREYEEDVISNVFIAFDISKSISDGYTKTISKLEYSKFIVASLSFLFANQKDRVGVGCFSEDFTLIQKPTNKSNSIFDLDSKLQNIKGKGKTNFLPLSENINRLYTSKLILIIISDFVVNLDNLFNSLKQMQIYPRQIILFHLIDETERNFNFKGEVVFQCPEIFMKMFCNPSSIKKQYDKLFNEHMDKIKIWSNKRNIEYNKIYTDTPYTANILNYLKKYQI